MAIEFNKKYFSLYLNGELVNKVAFSKSFRGVNLGLTLGGDNLKCEIDDLKIYNYIDTKDIVENVYSDNDDFKIDLNFNEYFLDNAKGKIRLSRLDDVEYSVSDGAYIEDGFLIFEDYLSVLKMMTDLTGDNKAYEKNGEALKTQIEEAKSRQDGSEPSVCIIRVAGTAVSVKGSDDTVLSEMCKDLGCKNIADEHESLLENLSMETIIEADPDFIFVVYQGTDEEASSKVFEENVSSNEAWRSLSAVKNGNFYVMDRTLYNLKPNARWGEAYEKLADIIYP